MFLVKLIASSFLDLISKQVRPDCHCKHVLVLFIYFIYFATQNVQRKKGKKNTLKNKSGQGALNRNHRAYTIRLLQLQPMMATHIMQKSLEKVLNFGSKNLCKPSKERLSYKSEMSLSKSCPFHISYVECGIP